MTYNMAAIFGPPEGIPENVKVGAYVLCRDCSRGVHTTEHTVIDRCACDLCGTEVDA